MDEDKKRREFIIKCEKDRLNAAFEALKEGEFFEDPLAVLIYERDYYKNQYEILRGLQYAADMKEEYYKELEINKIKNGN